MLARFLAYTLIAVLLISGLGACIGYVGMLTGNDRLHTLGGFLALPCFFFMVFLLAGAVWAEMTKKPIEPCKNHKSKSDGPDPLGAIDGAPLGSLTRDQIYDED